MSNLVTYELKGEIAHVGLNREAKRNAINDALVDALHVAVERAQREARAGVLFGHGDNFSSGLDLGELVARTPMENMRGSRRWAVVFDEIERGGIPFVAALQGAVIGGGLELAAAAHIRVADATAFFALPEGQRGIFVGGGGSVRIARLMSAARMADLMLTGRVLSTGEAERCNLVQYPVPAGAAMDKAVELARRIATNAPVANFAVTNALPRIQDLSHDDGLFFESAIASLTCGAPETVARLNDFLEKRAERLRLPDGVQRRSG